MTTEKFSDKILVLTNKNSSETVFWSMDIIKFAWKSFNFE